MVDATAALLAHPWATRLRRRTLPARRPLPFALLLALAFAPCLALPAEPTEISDIRDIRAPVTIASGWEWWPWALATLIALLLLYLLVQWWRRKPVPPPPIVVPPHVRARDRLRQALDLIRQPEPFCTSISHTLRLYLEERFQWHAPERTTEEFLDELQTHDNLDPCQKRSLAEFLTRCDLVKFARQTPGEPDLRQLLELALRLVEQTTPLPPAAPQAPDAPQTSSTQPAIP
jgi:hypothetical protein